MIYQSKIVINHTEDPNILREKYPFEGLLKKNSMILIKT